MGISYSTYFSQVSGATIIGQLQPLAFTNLRNLQS
jgi:hypothetical protein